MKKVIIVKSFDFEAAHKLPDHPGKCKNLHGHRWQGEVRLSCMENLLVDGMVLDFSDVKNMLNLLVVNHYDHKYLNDYFELPTCENLAMKIFDDIGGYLGQFYPQIHLESVRLDETEGNYCEVRKATI